MKTGLGIRPELFNILQSEKPSLGFLEAHSENYFGSSINRAKLNEIREHYPVSLHGVGLSLGRADDLAPDHLKNLKLLVDEIEPLLVSEHLAWSAYSHRHVPDLLPLPLTKQSMSVICAHIEQMQDTLQRQILIENPSNYLLFDQWQMPEPEFLNAIAAHTGCGLLVDVNNIYVSASNLQRDAAEYIRQLNGAAIAQYHLAGYTEVERGGEQLLIDTHNHVVYEPVWDLFELMVQQHGARPTLFEWDSDFPDLQVLIDECEKADRILEPPCATELQNNQLTKTEVPDDQRATSRDLAALQKTFLDSLLDQEETLPLVIEPHQHRVWVYQNNVYAAAHEYLQEVYPAVSGVVGLDFFKQMSRFFIRSRPPADGNIHLYGQHFADTLGYFESLAELSYLKDLIDYEWALHKAYFSKLVSILDPNGVTQQELLSIPVEFNSSVSLIESDYPIYEIHRQSLPDYHNEVAIDLGQSHDNLLVYKQEHAVRTKVLNADEATVINALANSENLLQAIDSLNGSIAEDSLSTTLAMIFELRLFSSKSIH